MFSSDLCSAMLEAQWHLSSIQAENYITGNLVECTVALTIHKDPSETTHCIGRSVKDRPIKYQRMTLGNKVVNYNTPGWSNEHFWGSANHWICQCLSGSYHWCETSFSLASSIDHWTSTKTKDTKVRVGETSASVINIPNGALLQMIPHLHFQ